MKTNFCHLVIIPLVRFCKCTEVFDFILNVHQNQCHKLQYRSLSLDIILTTLHIISSKHIQSIDCILMCKGFLSILLLPSFQFDRRGNTYNPAVARDEQTQYITNVEGLSIKKKQHMVILRVAHHVPVDSKLESAIDLTFLCYKASLRTEKISVTARQTPTLDLLAPGLFSLRG